MRKKKRMPDPVENVPRNEVGATVQSFIDDDDVKKLNVEEQPDGLFTITPTG